MAIILFIDDISNSQIVNQFGGSSRCAIGRENSNTRKIFFWKCLKRKTRKRTEIQINARCFRSLNYCKMMRLGAGGSTSILLVPRNLESRRKCNMFIIFSSNDFIYHKQLMPFHLNLFYLSCVMFVGNCVVSHRIVHMMPKQPHGHKLS